MGAKYNFNIKWLKSDLSETFILLLSFLLFTYTTVRAYKLSFTYDESWSFFGVYDFNFFSLFHSSNSHVVNSVLMYLSSLLFGYSELALRLPNLFAHVLYMIFSYLILKRIGNKIILIAGFLLLNTNPFVLDFFSLARGYGLALAFMMGSIFFFLLAVEEKNEDRNIFIATIFASISVMSNYTFLNYYLALVFVLCLFLLMNKQLSVAEVKRWGTSNTYFLIYNALFFIGLMVVLLRLKNRNEFYFGGVHGFVEDSISSLVKSSYYFVRYPDFITNLIYLFILLIFTISFIIFIKEILKFKKLTFKSALFVILIIATLSPILQNVLLNSLFLVERTALLYIPLFLLVFIFFFNGIERKVPLLKVLVVGVFLSFAIAGTYHFARVSNFNVCYSWRYDAYTKTVVKQLKHLNQENDQIDLGISWLFRKSILYYKIRDNLDWLKFTVLDKPWLYDAGLEELSVSYYRRPEDIPIPKIPDDTLLRHQDYYYVIRYKGEEFKGYSTVINDDLTNTYLLKNPATISLKR